MARFLTVNGHAFAPGVQRARVKEQTPVTITITLTDADAVAGDKYQLRLSGGGIVFDRLFASVPAGASPPVNLAFVSTDGFRQPGDWSVAVAKTAGAGANPISPIWTINFQVEAQPQPAPRTDTAPEPRPPATDLVTRTPAQTPQPQERQPPPAQKDGGWIMGLSKFTIVMSALAALIMLLGFKTFLCLLKHVGIKMMTGLSAP